MEIGIGRAHGKVILLGEHAVVYGAPALAIPVPQLTVTASAALADDEGEVLLTGPAPAGVAEQAARGLGRLVAEFAERTGMAEARPVDLLVDCMIPPGRGLGSSAACARAVVVALANLHNHRLGADAVFDLVQSAEVEAHGRASGIDTHSTGSPHSIFFRQGDVRELRIGFDGLFVVADSGAVGRTKDAVAMLARAFDRDAAAKADFVGRVTSISEAALDDLARGSATAFGSRLTDNHSVLSGAGLSTPLIDALVDAALDEGALGAKISGGGLGGCMIALVRDPRRAQAVALRLAAAGAVRTWVVPAGMSTGHAH